MPWRFLIDTSLIMTVLIYAVLSMLAMISGVFGIVLFWLLAISLWRYGYTVLRSVAQDRPSLPPPSFEDMNFANEFSLTTHFVLFPGLVMYMLLAKPLGTSLAGELLNSLIVVLLVFVFPASAAIIGLTSSLVGALNPNAIASVVKSLGRDYLILIGVCTALSLFSYQTQVTVLSRLGSAWGIPVVMLAIWTLLALFVLIGASLHAHRFDFVLPGVTQSREEREAVEVDTKRQAGLDLAYASIRSGFVTEAYRTLKQLVEDDNQSIELQYWLFENLLDRGHPECALRIAADLIQQLVEEKALPRAFELFVRCRRLSSDFCLRKQTAGELAIYAREIGQAGHADDLIAEIGGQSADRSI